VLKRGAAPLLKTFPPLLLKALTGEGDQGGEVLNKKQRF